MAMTSSTVVQKYLIGEFPASREQLVARAVRQGADEGVVNLIRTLQGERFDSATSVEQALESSRSRS